MKRLILFFVVPVAVALCFGTLAAMPVEAAHAGVIASPAGHHHHYDVFYGTCEDDLHFYGAYDSLYEARHAAVHLRERGYWTSIRHS